VPAFNRESFSNILEHAGIEYVVSGDSLGGRPKIEVIDYDEISRRPWFLKGIGRLINMAGEHRTAIMCAEENPYKCHRHKLIAPTLLERQAQVLHIRAHGGLESAESHIDTERQMDFFTDGRH
jgi:uncharacterized protein (DUF488 family)